MQGRVELLEGDNIRENFDASISPDAGKKAKKRSAPGKGCPVARNTRKPGRQVLVRKGGRRC